jgi:hypothetical protein
MEGSKMAEEVFWSAIFLAALGCLFIGRLKWGALVTLKRVLDPEMRSSDVGSGWLREVVMQLSA